VLVIGTDSLLVASLLLLGSDELQVFRLKYLGLSGDVIGELDDLLVDSKGVGLELGYLVVDVGVLSLKTGSKT
jgi:hypothetical protein